MTAYTAGYELYKKMCEAHGLTPINFRLYINQLSTEQLLAFNTEAKG
ncbi:transcriptional regulator [Caryophanon latum]|uniref:Transcriptional regulator n=1 Tax=Caryophanon latum TaxID=33977 RepID=A0A1C0YBR4_9BACL|nr:transcriptional regulator [Caryophanon latum]OCS84573.1 transcriptional regulator [Caryophanon latum]